jgi:hypothetical protein
MFACHWALAQPSNPAFQFPSQGSNQSVQHLENMLYDFILNGPGAYSSGALVVLFAIWLPCVRECIYMSTHISLYNHVRLPVASSLPRLIYVMAKFLFVRTPPFRDLSEYGVFVFNTVFSFKCMEPVRNQKNQS